MKLDSGHEVFPLSEEEQKDQKKNFEAYGLGMVRLIPGNWFFTKSITKYANAVYNFKMKPNDVMIVTYPKCGTTWMQEIVWTMRNNPDLTNPMAAMPVNARCPFLEIDFLMKCSTLPDSMPPESSIMQMFAMMCPGKDPEDGIFLQLADALPDPRTMKTHVPLSMLPPNILDTCKVIYLVRDPKDAVVSYHHHSRIMKPHQFVGDFDQFVQYFVDDALVYGPYWPHLKEGWAKKSHPNLHFCHYEDHKSDPKKGMKALNEFLGTNLADSQIDKIVEYTSFKAMKERDNLLGGKEDQAAFLNVDIMEKDGGFFRKGESGSYKSKLTAEHEAKIDEWARKNMDGLPSDFKYAPK